MTTILLIYLVGILATLGLDWPSVKAQGATFWLFFFWSFRWPWEVAKALFTSND